MGSKSIQQQDGAWMKLGEAALALGVSEITLRRRVRSGRLPYDFRAGKYFVFVPNVLDRNAFLDGPGGSDSALGERVRPPVRNVSDLRAESPAAFELAKAVRPHPKPLQAPRPGSATGVMVSDSGSSERGSLGGSTERAAAAANILRPYARAQEAKPELRVNGPSHEQVVSILKTDLREKDQEIVSLKAQVAQLEARLARQSSQWAPMQKQIADQTTLLAALEAAYSEAELELAELRKRFAEKRI